MTNITPPGAVQVLDYGFVKLLNPGENSDLSVVNSARVSFAKSQDEMDEAGEGLVRFLMRERHGTPFEHNQFRFHVRAPIFVIREWQRHRMASYNEESGRYSEMQPLFYNPRGNMRTQVGKPGAYRFEPMDPDTDRLYSSLINDHSRDSYYKYRALLTAGVAKEVARLVLPPTLYSQFYFSVNARGLMNFLSLRNHEHALYEIRVYAAELELLFAADMPVTADAFVKNGRKAP